MTNRLFIALEIPEQALDSLIEYRKKNYDDDRVRWETRNKLHITLKFLGDVDIELIPNIINSLESVLENKDKICLQFSKFGVFYRNNNPSILWAGLNNSRELLDIQKEIDVAMSDLGFQKEKRKFKPHLTLLRIKGRENISKILKLTETELNIDEFNAGRIVIFKSTLLKSGSVYEEIKSFELK